MKSRYVAVGIIVSIFLSILTSFAAFEKFEVDRVNSIGHTQYAQHFYIPNDFSGDSDKTLKLFHSLSSKYSVSILKSYEEFKDDHYVVAYAGVFSQSTFPIEQLRLISGTFINNTDDFLSTEHTDNPQQVGRLFNFAGLNHFKIISLDSYISANKPLSGSYIVSSSRPYDYDELLDTLTRELNISKNQLLSPVAGKSISYNHVVIQFSLILGITLMSCGLSMLSYTVTHAHAIAKLKLMGWSSLSIWGKMIRTPFLSAFLFSLLSIIVAFVFHQYVSLSFILLMIGSQFVTYAMCFLISLVSYMTMSHVPAIASIKRKVSFRVIYNLAFVIKLLFMMAIFTAIVSILPHFDMGLKQFLSQSQWREYKSYYIVKDHKLTSTEISDLNNQTFENAKKYAENYDVMVQQFHALYALNWGANRMIVNNNWLTSQDIRDINDQLIHIDEQEQDRVILVPESKQSQLTDILKEEKEFLLSWQNMNQQRFKETPKGNRLKYILYKDTKEFFNLQSNPDYASYIQSPIFHVITSANALFAEKSYWGEGLRPVLFFPITHEESSNLRHYLEESTLSDSRISIDTLESTFYAQLSKQGIAFSIMCAAIGTVFLLSSCSTYILIKVMLATKEKQMAIKRLLGWSAIYRHGVLSNLILALDVIFPLVTIIITRGVTALAIALIISSLDVIIYSMMFSHFDHKNLIATLKEC